MLPELPNYGAEPMPLSIPSPNDRAFAASMERMGYASGGSRLLAAVPKMAEVLAPFRVVVTVREALAMLHLVGNQARLLALYKHYFPEQFATSSASMAAPPNDYSPREREFFALVDAKMFPLDEWKLSYGRMVTDLLPVGPQSLGWEEESFDHFRPGWQFLFALLELIDYAIDVDDEDSREYYEELLSALSISEAEWQAIRAVGGYPGLAPWDGLFRLTKALPAENPLRYLATAVSYVHHCTGNAWFDMESDRRLNMRWRTEDMDKLFVLWWGDPESDVRGGNEISRETVALVEWLEAGAENRMECIRFWESAVDANLAEMKSSAKLYVRQSGLGTFEDEE